MSNIFSPKHLPLIWFRTALMVVILGLGGGCSSSQPPLKPAMVVFTKAVQEACALLLPPLREPVAKGDITAINNILEKTISQVQSNGKTVPFNIAIADKAGIALTRYPLAKILSMDFSKYEVIAKAKEGKIAQSRFYLPNETKVYVVVAPIILNSKVTGFMGFYLSDQELREKWGLTEEEFLALNFNQ
jgi:hypothetical protein